MKRYRLIVCCGLMALAASRLAAQPPAGIEAPRPLRLQIVDTYLDLNFEMEHQLQKAGVPSEEVTHDRIMFQPVLGLGVAGSVYHPNLVTYHLNTELGLDWQYTSQTPGHDASNANFLQRYHVLVEFLRQKPYAFSVFADKDLTYRDYDFFTRTRVESERYGAHAGYSEGPVPFNVGYTHREERETELARPTKTIEDNISFTAHNNRRNGKANTEFNYSYNDFTRQDDGFNTQHGLSQSVSVFDSEQFGLRDWVQCNTVVNYNSITKTIAPTETVLAQESVRLRHTPRFDSSYDYAYNHTTAGDSDSDSHQIRAGISHRLFESLTSNFDLHGDTSHATSPGSTLDNKRYGFGISEQYTKKLSAWGTLNLGYTGRFDREEREASGAFLVIVNETHTLTDAVTTFLNQLLADTSSIHVTDPTETITYVLGVDYEIISHSLLTEIRRIPGGLIINGGAVLVDYRAALQPSDRFIAMVNETHFRLELWKGLIGVFARWNKLDYSGGKLLVLRTIDDKTFGVDSTWRWFRAGAEYEVCDSNLAPYDRLRFFQSASCQPAEGIRLSLDVDENWTTFRDTNTHESNYGAIVRYQHQFAAQLSWFAEGGVRIERGDTSDRDTGTARVGLDWAIGKLNVKVGYEFNQENYIHDTSERHYFFLRARRTF